MSIFKKTILSSCIALANMAWLGEAAAVGGGLKFNFDEDPIARPNVVSADSLDLTYHACTRIQNGVMNERGYYWNSSFQDVDSVVDSQINHVGPNGYHIYARYNFEAIQRGVAQRTITGDRLNYEVLDGAIEKWVDPKGDTEITFWPDCKFEIINNSDDQIFGSASAIAQGEKAEADGLAQGDFKIVFDNWTWGQAGNLLMSPEQGAGYLDQVNFLVFNANVTNLNGPLGDNHRPEGSGNVFWLKDFEKRPLSVE